MRKLVSILLCLLLVLSACGSQKNSGGSANGNNSTNGNGSTNGDGTANDGGDTDSDNNSDDADIPADGGYYEAGLGEALHPYWFDFTVNSAYVCQTFGKYTAAEGKRLVVADLTVENVCDFPVDMYQDDFQIEWDDDSEGGYALALPAKATQDKGVFPDEYTLKVGESREGLLVYEVPAGESPDYYITFLEVFDDGTEAGREGGVFVAVFSAGEDPSAPV